MRRRSVWLALAIAVAAAAALVWWLRTRGGDGGAEGVDAGAVAVPAGPPTPKRMPADRERSPAPPQPAEVAREADPIGGLRLEGQVIDADETPIAGALVVIHSVPFRTTINEDDGSFAFDKLVPRKYTLEAQAGERTGGPIEHSLSASSDPVTIRMRLGVTLEITVVDQAGGAPIAGATVVVRDLPPRSAATDAEGRARFVGLGGDAGRVVTASARGFAPRSQFVRIPQEPGATIRQQLALVPGAAVTGRVLTEAGKPVAGARVLALDTASLMNLASKDWDAVISDPQGRFELPAVAAGSYRLVAHHEDYPPASSELLHLDGATPRSGVAIVLKAGATLAGVVHDTAGAPVPYATVRVGVKQSEAMDPFASGSVRQIICGDDGRFRLVGLMRTEVLVVASSEAASSATTPVDLRARPTITDLVLTLALDGVISGIVVDSKGEPIAEAQVLAFPDFWGGSAIDDWQVRGSSSQTSDGGGRFAFRGLPAGAYRIRAARAALSDRSWLQPGVQAKTGDTDVRVVLAADGGVKGKAQFADGAAPGLFTASVGWAAATPVSHPAGEFALEPLPPGTYDLTLRGTDFPEKVVRDVVVAEGEITDLGTVALTRGRAVSGRVVDAQGSAVAGAEVVLAKQLVGDGSALAAGFGGFEDFWGLRRAVTGDDGSFRFAGIGDDELAIAAQHAERGRSLPKQVPAGPASPTVELTLAPFGALTGRITAGGQPLAGASVMANPQRSKQTLAVQAGDDGTYLIEKLAAGPYAVTAMTAGEGGASANMESREVTVTAGKPTRVDIELKVGNIALAITVKGEKGAHIDAAQIFLTDGELVARNVKELTDNLTAAGGGGLKMTFAMGAQPGRFEQLGPGPYTACIIPINGDMNDPSFMQRLQASSMTLAVHCRPVLVRAAPAEQNVTLEVPPMAPLP